MKFSACHRTLLATAIRFPRLENGRQVQPYFQPIISSPLNLLFGCCLFLLLHSSTTVSAAHSFQGSIAACPICISSCKSTLVIPSWSILFIGIIMSEVLRSILCGEDYWCWDPHGGCTIKFNEDGTGEVHRTTYSSSLETSWTVYKLLCAAELLLWIAAEFEWKLQNIESLDQNVDLKNVIDDARKNHPRLVGRFTIELTLSKRCFPRLRQSVQGRKCNESLLIDDAFLPKTYTITLEKGFFKTPYDVIEDEYTQRYALRLVWEPSPYPPREEWKGAQPYSEALKFWEYKIFCGRSSEELRKLANGRWWESCVVS